MPVLNAAVVGAGSWGTALALLLARNGHTVRLVGRSPDEISSILEHRENLRYLPGFPLPANIEPSLLQDLTAAQAEGADMFVIAVPSGAVREICQQWDELCHSDYLGTVAIAAKGLEVGTAKLMAEVVLEEIPAAKVAVLSGPNLAVEIARGIPTVAVAAAYETVVAESVAAAFHSRRFRVAPRCDVVGVEIAGALKNVLAIGAGMSDGIGFGDNTKAAFLSRGLVEMAALGLAMGGKIETFLGPAGVGDLFATAVSQLSRNYRFGKLIATGYSFAEALETIGQVVEGISSSEAALILGAKFGVELPVISAVDAVMRGQVSPQGGVELLMDRPIRPAEG